jgi:hypothetical protein
MSAILNFLNVNFMAGWFFGLLLGIWLRGRAEHGAWPYNGPKP